MRHVLPIAAALLAACQPEQPANMETAGSDAAINVSGNEAVRGGPSTDPDTPVSSDEAPAPLAATPISQPDCPIIRSSDWHAHVDAMPGPNDNPRLIVSGKVTVPTGGYKLNLRMGQVAESYPVQVTIHLDAVPPKGPATQALVTREVRGSWPSEERVGSVTIRCGGRAIASLSDIETAR